MKDWEEVLWHTDPNKYDTDDDGTSDGQEVKENRDPTKAGPKDTLSEPKYDTTTNTDTASVYKYEFDKSLGANLTENLADNLTVNYLNAKAKGTFDNATAESIANNLAQEFASSELYRNITEKDLRIVPATDTNMKSYLMSSYQAITYNYKSVGTEIAIINNAFQSGNYTELTLLELSAKDYAHSLSLLLALPVPNTQIKEHLALAQAYDTLVRSLRVVAENQNDIILATKEMGRYAKAMEQISLMYRRGQALAMRYWSLSDLPDLP